MRPRYLPLGSSEFRIMDEGIFMMIIIMIIIIYSRASKKQLLNLHVALTQH